MVRSRLTSVLAGLLALGLSAAPAPAADAGKCNRAKGESPVAKACAQGGIKEAKVVMKALTKKAKEAGVKFTCDDCHSDDTKYDVLADGAEEKFKKLLAAAESK